MTYVIELYTLSLTPIEDRLVKWSYYLPRHATMQDVWVSYIYSKETEIN